ncbi:type VI secretion system membrane subunit TssM [Desulfomicrobium escambiense]|uniref:type VI secretion system membrane subunit TssM n=1 Tax=Desulfomicrobium escambiense TaxID=29503 RepID=UPI00041CC1DF|nr:type VI secretion system membrane subunit TssM [Desulfomicrobium escambiense]
MIRRFLHALREALGTSWVQGLLLAVLLLLVLWTLGPLVAVAGHVVFESVTARLVGSLAIVFMWGLLVAVMSSRQKRREAVNPEIAARKDRDAVARGRFREELEHIRHVLKSAIRIVTTSNFYGPTSRSRYALPWYLVLGPANCGKTSLLLNSGLQFPLNEQADRHLYKVKGTDRAEILFANQAVFIDTPGAYAEGAPESEAHGLWTAFLRRLFRVRPAKALNGVVVCVSMREMLDGDSSRREHLARTVRARLSEVLKHLRSYVPVYLVFTKCDAVPGFAQFFSHLSRSEREQIFGCLAGTTALAGDGTRNELRALIQTLNAQIITKIHQERDSLARAAMFRFPQELAALAPRIQDFVFEAFGPSRYHRPVLFRGFFFSSALSSSDIMGGAALGGELSYQSGFQASLGDYARGFFLLRLFENFIIPEAGLADVDRDRIWLLRLRRFGLQLMAGLLLVGGVSLLALSFRENFNRMAVLETIARNYEQKRQGHLQAADAVEMLPELALLEQALTVFCRGSDPPLTRGLGLYQGASFEDASRRAYLGALNTRFLPLVRQAAVTAVASSLGDLGPLKTALRAYLMLCQPAKLNETFLMAWLERQWSASYSGRADVQRALMRHMAYLIDHGISPVLPDERLLAKARESMLKTPLSQLAYQQMKDEAADGDHTAFTFRGALGGLVSPFSGDTHPIPHLYTAAGFQEYVVQRCPQIIQGLGEDNWMFGPNPPLFSSLDMDKIAKDVRVMYFRDYIRHWGQALDALGVVRPGNMAGAAALAEQLSAGVSPVVLLLRELRKNIAFTLEEQESGGLEVAVEEQAARKGMQKLTGVAGAKLARAATETAIDAVALAHAKATREALKDAQMVRTSFKSLDGLLDAEGMPTQTLKEVHDGMARAGDFFRRIRESDDRGRKVLEALEGVADERDETLRQVARATEKLPAPVRQWYEAVLHGGLGDMFAIGASAIDAAYRATVLNEYNVNLRSRYPFDMDSESDASLADFANFFRKNGVLDSFYDTYVRPFVGDNGGLRPIMGRTLPISVEAIRRLNFAERVQEAFFVSDKDLGVHFLMEPYALDVTLKQADLSHGDKALSYWHGPVQGGSFSWPLGEGRPSEASFAISDIHEVKAHRVMRGDWALFRLLRRGKISQLAENRCLVELRENGKWAQFLIQFRNKANPFDPETCTFSLPESLL